MALQAKRSKIKILDAPDYVMLLAYQKYETPTGKTGRVYTDYAECEITYVSGTEQG